MTDPRERPAVLRADEVSVVIDDTVLLQPTTFEARSGELWAVTGPNGSGKTTLLRALLGTREVTTGSCSVLGEPVDLTQPHQRRAVAALVEPIPVARDMTVVEQMSLVALSWAAPAQGIAELVDGLVEELRIGPLVDRFPHELSSGQLQLFTLGLVLARPAEVLLLDEPERHLDAERVRSLAGTLRRRAESGVAVVVSSHDPVLTAAAHHELGLG